MTSPVSRIVAIGGGEIGRPKENRGEFSLVETSSIDKEILRLTNKKSATLLFISTASNDSRQYASLVKEHFQNIGFASVDTLLLSDTSMTKKQIEETILSHDAIYVGGGNTQKMMTIWRERGVDIILKQALESGIILSGISAGSICWFNRGISDSKQSIDDNRKFIEVAGLGFIDAVHCPHYDVNSYRYTEVKKSIKHTSKVAICLENCTAIEIIGDKYRIIQSKPGARAYKAYWKNGNYFVERIAVDGPLKNLDGLLRK